MARKKPEAEKAAETTESPSQPSRAGLIVGSVALLLALAAGGVAVWSQIQLQSLRSLSQQVSGDQSQLQGLTRRVDRLTEDGLEIREALMQQRETTREAAGAVGELGERLQRAEQALDSLPGVNQRSRADWLKTEALYYLRIANAQALLTQDPDIAASALQLADEKLLQAGDPAVHAASSTR